MEHLQSVNGSEPTLAHHLGGVENEMWSIRQPQEVGAALLDLMTGNDSYEIAVSSRTDRNKVETPLAMTSRGDRNVCLDGLPDELLIQIISMTGDNQTIRQLGMANNIRSD